MTTKEVIVYTKIKQVYNPITGSQDTVVRPIGKIILFADGTIEYVNRQS